MFSWLDFLTCADICQHGQVVSCACEAFNIANSGCRLCSARIGQSLFEQYPMNSELRKAIEQGSLAAVVTALDAGAEIEHPDVHGDPGLPLRLACFKGRAEIVVELLKRGADIHSPNAQGAGAPIRMAARARHDDLVRLLLAHGADMPPDLKTQFTETGERRKRGERRRHSYGPPKGLKERRRTLDRRVTFVREVELSDFQWETYFSQSLVNAKAEVKHEHEPADVASLVFERIRD